MTDITKIRNTYISKLGEGISKGLPQIISVYPEAQMKKRHCFNPTSILITGKRDLLLSNTARLQQKRKSIGKPNELLVFEGYSMASVKFRTYPKLSRSVNRLSLFRNLI